VRVRREGGCEWGCDGAVKERRDTRAPWVSLWWNAPQSRLAHSSKIHTCTLKIRREGCPDPRSAASPPLSSQDQPSYEHSSSGSALHRQA